MALTLTTTRKDKPILGFLKDGPATGVIATARRMSRDPVTPQQPAPVFRSTRSRPLDANSA